MHCRLLTQYAIVMVQFLAGLRKIKLLAAHIHNCSSGCKIVTFAQFLKKNGALPLLKKINTNKYSLIKNANINTVLIILCVCVFPPFSCFVLFFLFCFVCLFLRKRDSVAHCSFIYLNGSALLFFSRTFTFFPDTLSVNLYPISIVCWACFNHILPTRYFSCYI